MTAAASGLADPPDDLAALDTFPVAAWVPELHRLSEWPGVWWYSTVATADDPSGGRFDLPRPRGTCYLAESLDGALVQKLLRTETKIVVAERLEELFHATVAVGAARATADLTSPAATGFGLNAEVHATLDYRAPRRWADALWRRGWRALRYLLRGNVAGRQAGRALFGSAGLHARAPTGMSTKVRPLDRTRAEQLLADRGVTVRPIPSSVPVEAPPS